MRFEDLAPAAKQQAADQLQDRLYERVFLDDWQQQAQEGLEEQGVLDAKLRYSLGCSQGDGVSFTGDLDLEAWCLQQRVLTRQRLQIITGSDEGRCARFFDGARIEFRSNSNYCHSRSVETNIDSECDAQDSDWHDAIIEELRHALDTWYQGECARLEREGYAEIDYQTGIEAASLLAGDEGLEFCPCGTPLADLSSPDSHCRPCMSAASANDSSRSETANGSTLVAAAPGVAA